MKRHAHAQMAGGVAGIRCSVITVSDTRTLATDRSGQLIRALVDGAGHTVAAYHIIPDDPVQIRDRIEHAAEEADVVLINGGTGISPRDHTVDTLAAVLEKELVGFGELFRMLSYEQVGSAAMLSRATGGLVRNTLVFAMPGAPQAVSLALKRLILPELPHLVAELRKVPA